MIEKMNAKALAKLRAEEAERASWLPLKEVAIQMYSGCRGVCRGCGRGQIEALAVVAEEEWKRGYASVYGGHQRMLTAQKPLYQQLKDEGYPPGYLVLCVECFKEMVRLHRALNRRQCYRERDLH